MGKRSAHVRALSCRQRVLTGSESQVAHCDVSRYFRSEVWCQALIKRLRTTIALYTRCVPPETRTRTRSNTINDPHSASAQHAIGDNGGRIRHAIQVVFCCVLGGNDTSFIHWFACLSKKVTKLRRRLRTLWTASIRNRRHR